MPVPEPALVHVLVLPTQGVAEHVAGQLRDEGFAAVDVVATQEGCAVRVADPRLPDVEGGAAVKGLSARFESLATEHQGRYAQESGA